MANLKFDQIGYWSEIKIDIIRKYASAYCKIVKKHGFHAIYIDAFSGAGEHRRKKTEESIEGSPIVALNVTPKFDEFYFIDLDEHKIDHLKNLVGERSDVHWMVGDANRRLIDDVYPNIRYEQFKRALCLLDPYGLHLDWGVIAEAAKTRCTEIFINFPVQDMNRNVFWRNPEAVESGDIERMNRFWGDESWRNAAYSTEGDLFGHEHRTDNETIADAFRNRLKTAAGFNFVPNPLPMRNTQNAIVYYLFFASPNSTGEKIVGDIFKTYRSRRG